MIKTTKKENERKEKGMAEKIKMECLECGKIFKTNISTNQTECQCPGCGGYDTDVQEIPVVVTSKKLTCCICKGPIEKNGTWEAGNNAEPVVKNGRCCSMCNMMVVVPARIKQMQNQERS